MYRHMSPCYNALSHFYLYWIVFLVIDKLMPCGSIVNKATGQVCRPAEKKTYGKKIRNIKQNGIDLQTQDMYLQFIRSNMGANGNR